MGYHTVKLHSKAESDLLERFLLAAYPPGNVSYSINVRQANAQNTTISIDIFGDNQQRLIHWDVAPEDYHARNPACHHITAEAAEEGIQIVLAEWNGPVSGNLIMCHLMENDHASFSSIHASGRNDYPRFVPRDSSHQSNCFEAVGATRQEARENALRFREEWRKKNTPTGSRLSG